MTYEAQIERRLGDKSPVYGAATADTGTLTVQSGGTFTLYDSLGAVVSGFNGVALTGYDVAPSAEVKAWYNLDMAALTLGVYSGDVTFQALSSADGMIRTYHSIIEITLLGPVEAYDLTTTNGTVRFLLGDTDPSNPIWTEPEIDRALTMGGGRVLLAAAWALTIGAAQAARVAIIERASIFGTDNTKIPTLMRAQAKEYRELELLDADVVAAGAGSVRTDILEQFPPITTEFPLPF